MGIGTIFLTLGSAIVGWLLAQVTAGLKEWYSRKRIRTALLEELVDIEDLMKTHWLQWGRAAQVYVNGRVDNSFPLPITHPIYEFHYKDGALGLNRFQRRAIQMIHSFVDSQNEKVRECAALAKELNGPAYKQDGIPEELGEQFFDMVQNGMFGVRVIQWYICYYFEHPIAPFLDPMSPAHAKHNQYLDDVRKDIAKVIDGAEGMGLEKFEGFYRPEQWIKTPTE